MSRPCLRIRRGRWRWLVGEMDAARGLAGRAQPIRVSRQSGLSDDTGSLVFGVVEGAVRRGTRPVGRDASIHPSRLDATDPSQAHPDDVPDPHVLGMGLHALAYEQMEVLDRRAGAVSAGGRIAWLTRVCCRFG